MSAVLGIDFASAAIDLVFLDETEDVARWHRIPLEPGWTSSRMMRHKYAWGSELEHAGVYLVALEQPMMQQRNSIAALSRIQGAILASLPPEVAVWLLAPAEWKLGIGMKGNASTQLGKPGAFALLGWALQHGAEQDWPTDACAALAMAYTAREINQHAIDAA